MLAMDWTWPPNNGWTRHGPVCAALATGHLRIVLATGHHLAVLDTCRPRVGLAVSRPLARLAWTRAGNGLC